ncbi:hypothetical protein GCM10027046_24480 [Uliginosibacterium flavum]|uniref:Secretin N-terminal domain-containing protein n=1 Tax=Uliginosibacterium flavum TaxID=1396831 RepID=A0ABV2TKE2_9RHOO
MTRIHSLGAALLATALLCSCSDAVRRDLEQGRALSASGRLADAYQTLQQSSEANPGNSKLRDAATEAGERYGNFLAQRAEGMLTDQRFDEAAVLFRQLATVKGFEAKAQDGLARAAQGPVLARPLPVPSRVVSVPAPAPFAPVVEAKPAPAPAPAPVLVETKPAPALVPALVEAKPEPAPMPAPVLVETKPASAPAVVEARPAPVVAAVEVPPVVSPARAEPVRVIAAKKVEPPPASPVLKEDPLLKRVTLEFRDASVRSLFDAITRASGLNVIFDRDVSQDLKTTVYLRNTTVKAALDKVVLTSGLAWRTLDENTLLVYTDDTNKQHDYQALTVRSFQLANADVKMVANSLKTVLKFRDLVVDEKLNMIIVRDTPAAIAMAEKLIAMHDVAEPEVMLEVTILEVSKGKLQNLGVAWPGSMSLTPLARTVSSTASTTDTTSGTVSSSTANTLTLRDLWNLTPGSLAMGLGATTLNFNETDNDVNMLANPRIRTRNKEKAKIMIGERVPQLASNTTSTGVVSQNVTYIDVGIKLDVEPQIYPGNEVGLKINLEVSSINGTEKNGTTVAYRIGTRNASTMLRLKDGENQILAGLIQDSDKKSVSKVPLLGDIPLLGRLFRSDTDDKGKTELVLSITPRLIRGNHFLKPEAAGFDGGTYSGVRGRRGEGSDASSIEPMTQQQPVQAPQSNGDPLRQAGESGSRMFGGSRD